MEDEKQGLDMFDPLAMWAESHDYLIVDDKAKPGSYIMFDFDGAEVLRGDENAIRGHLKLVEDTERANAESGRKEEFQRQVQEIHDGLVDLRKRFDNAVTHNLADAFVRHDGKANIEIVNRFDSSRIRGDTLVEGNYLAVRQKLDAWEREAVAIEAAYKAEIVQRATRLGMTFKDGEKLSLIGQDGSELTFRSRQATLTHIHQKEKAALDQRLEGTGLRAQREADRRDIGKDAGGFTILTNRNEPLAAGDFRKVGLFLDRKAIDERTHDRIIDAAPGTDKKAVMADHKREVAAFRASLDPKELAAIDGELREFQPRAEKVGAEVTRNNEFGPYVFRSERVNVASPGYAADVNRSLRILEAEALEKRANAIMGPGHIVSSVGEKGFKVMRENGGEYPPFVTLREGGYIEVVQFLDDKANEKKAGQSYNPHGSRKPSAFVAGLKALDDADKDKFGSKRDRNGDKAPRHGL
ncbi:hypothetical protein BB934_45120 (plasmid) [Microvirga ossetica]|uniref:Uncharacterized protein n=1 Tax=Microvirga ossetica TaxID=1882682 RepID=A0A1B2EZP2_9HYPH|nr:hypothetical protein [Microvirga ossetica]ANY85403.1 hypothetical protein BB934_45120 [Microvirga ossetica]